MIDEVEAYFKALGLEILLVMQDNYDYKIKSVRDQLDCNGSVYSRGQWLKYPG